MYENEIIHACVTTPELLNYVQGVYTADELPLALNGRNGAYIYNTGCRQSGGRHWCLINIRNNHVEYFNSLAIPPLSTSTLHAILKFNDPFYYSTEERVQDDNSATCGYFVLFTAMKLSQGHPLHQIIKLLKHYETLTRNGRIIELCHMENINIY